MTSREAALHALAQTVQFLIPVVAAVGVMLAGVALSRCVATGPLPSLDDAYALEQFEDSNR